MEQRETVITYCRYELTCNYFSKQTGSIEHSSIIVVFEADATA
jgi:hypothetical protein